MSQSNTQVPLELRCTYRSKPCPNERARKRNGTLHKLCQTHRLKANKTQRDMQRRLREQRRQEQLERQLAAMQFNGEEFQAIELLDEFLKAEIPLELDPDTELDMWDIPEPLEEPVDLNPEDIELLVALLGTSRSL
ncbi:Serine-threonine kinase receptor-associated protein [Phytophthora cinnamomi]|nr:Serine-threonine kinase receptor-associated protein [Phytophthora cinnamomi]